MEQIIKFFSEILGFIEPVKDIFDVLDKVTIITAFFTLFFVFRNWLNNRKQNDTVKIVLFQNDKRDELDLYILRKNFTRAEVKGILRELNESQTFEIDYISNPKSTFLKDIYEIQSGEKDSLIIDILISDNFKLKGNQ